MVAGPGSDARRRTREWFGQAVRFALVGVVNTGVYYGLYVLGLLVTGYLTAHLVALLVAMVVSYLLNVVFTYRTRPTLRTFVMYPLANLANYVLLTVGLWLLVSVMHVDERLAPVLVAVVAVPVTFLLTRAMLLPRPGAPTERSSTPSRP